MDTSSFDMLHNTWDEVILTIADCIDLNLFTHHVFIDQDEVVFHVAGDDVHVLFYFSGSVSNDHVLATQYIGRTQQNWEAQSVCSSNCFFFG